MVEESIKLWQEQAILYNIIHPCYARRSKKRLLLKKYYKDFRKVRLLIHLLLI